jgi:hypothetical protein
MNTELFQILSEYTGLPIEQLVTLAQENPEEFDNMVNQLQQAEQEVMQQPIQQPMGYEEPEGEIPYKEEMEDDMQPQDQPGIGAGSVSNNPAGFDQSAYIEQLYRLEKTATGQLNTTDESLLRASQLVRLEKTAMGEEQMVDEAMERSIGNTGDDYAAYERERQLENAAPGALLGGIGGGLLGGSVAGVGGAVAGSTLGALGSGYLSAKGAEAGAQGLGNIVQSMKDNNMMGVNPGDTHTLANAKIHGAIGGIGSGVLGGGLGGAVGALLSEGGIGKRLGYGALGAGLGAAGLGGLGYLMGYQTGAEYGAYQDKRDLRAGVGTHALAQQLYDKKQMEANAIAENAALEDAAMMENKARATQLVRLEKTAQQMPVEHMQGGANLTPEEMYALEQAQNQVRSRGTSIGDLTRLGLGLGSLGGAALGGLTGYRMGGPGVVPLGALTGGALGGLVGPAVGAGAGSVLDYAKDTVLPQHLSHTSANAATLGTLGALAGGAYGASLGGASGSGALTGALMKGLKHGSLGAGAGVVSGRYQDARDELDNRYREASVGDSHMNKQAYYNQDGTYVGDVVQGTGQGAAAGGIGTGLLVGGLGAAAGGLTGSTLGGLGGALFDWSKVNGSRMGGAARWADKGGWAGLALGGGIGGLAGLGVGSAAGGLLGGTGTAITSGIRRAGAPSEEELARAIMLAEQQKNHEQQKYAADNSISTESNIAKEPIKKTHTPAESEKEFYDFLRKVQGK